MRCSICGVENSVVVGKWCEACYGMTAMERAMVGRLRELADRLTREGGTVRPFEDAGVVREAIGYVRRVSGVVPEDFRV